MAKFNVGDRVKVSTAPDYWPACTEFTLLGAEGTVGCWVDWPEAMDPYSEFIYVTIDKASGGGKDYEGASMIFHEHTLQKV
jgi:hypothetical protein